MNIRQDDPAIYYPTQPAIYYPTRPVIEQIDERPLPLPWQLAAFGVACAACGALGFGWAWLIFGVLQ